MPAHVASRQHHAPAPHPCAHLHCLFGPGEDVEKVAVLQQVFAVGQALEQLLLQL